MKRLLTHLAPLAGLAAFLAALVVLHHALHGFHYHQLRDDLRNIPILAVVLACLLTLADYFVLTLYDLLSLRAVRGDLAYPKIAATSFMAYAFSHNLGYAVLSGGAMRWRFYSAWGLPDSQIAAITLLGGLAYWMGFLAVGGGVFLLWPPHDLHLLAEGSIRGIGIGLLLLVVAMLTLGLLWRRPIRIRTWEIPAPASTPSLVLMGIACLDWLLVVAVVWVLLPAMPGIGFTRFLGCFMLALAAGNVSQVPGGLGVLEASLLMMLGGKGSTPALAGALLAYRMIYYLVPFILAMALLCVVEGSRQRTWFGRVANAIRRVLRPLLPHAAGALAFLAGAALLVSGSTPIARSRVQQVERWIPLGLVEVSHVLASMCGMALLLLARGLQLRLRDAYLGCLVLLLAGAMLSVLKGFDVEEALLLLVCAGVIAPFPSAFPRPDSLRSPPLTVRWALGIISVLLVVCALTGFCYEHERSAGESEWHFAYDAYAPRSLRAGIAAASLLLGYTLWRSLAPAARRQRSAGR